MKRYVKVMIAVPAVMTLAWLSIPKPELLDGQQFSSAVYARDGTLLRLTLAEDEKYRLYAPIHEISPLLVEGTLLYEDRHFAYHPGFNPVSLVRAAWDTYVARSRAVGASTITMQVARILFAIDSRTIAGKLEQIARAVQLERHYAKQEIIEAYLNLAPYGRNIEGVAAASLIYFGKQPSELSLPEALALCVVPQNPTARIPSRPQGYREMASARQRLFEAWQAQHPEDGEQAALMELPLQVNRIEALPFYAPHFVRERLQGAWMGRTHSIRTTLDLGLQQKIEEISRSYIDKKRTFGFSNVSAILLDYRSMEVLASVGSADFFDPAIQGQVDGTDAKRSPGSTLKPFIYALAMDQGVIHPMSMLKDAPKRFGAYTPENFDRGFAGPVFAQDALIYSRNVPAVYLASQLQAPSFYEFLTRAGVSGMREESFYGLALALGGIELTMNELVTLYAMLANRGVIQKLRVELDEERSASAIRLLSPEASFLTLDMLSHNPRPETPLLIKTSAAPPVYWKTGTSFAFRDAWSIGVFGPYVLAVWVGNFNGEGNPSFVGRKAAAPLFFEIVDALTKGARGVEKGLIDEQGLDITRVDVCSPTGDLPGRYCPETIKSWFIPGKSPIRVSNVHRAVPVNRKSGLRACSADAENIDMEVFEFWPSDIMSLFRKAGVSRKVAPAFEPGCGIDARAASGVPPRIQSPGSNISYALRSDLLSEERIPFTAVADADVKQLFWFVDNQYVGFSSNGEPYYWKAELKQATVRVVDDHGRAATGRVAVELVR